MERNQLAVLLISSILIAGAVGLAIVANTNESGGERAVVDARDRTVLIPNDVEKMVCLSAGSVRLVSYFGQDAVDRIVGIDLNDANRQMLPVNYYKATYRIAFDIQSIECVGEEDSYKSIIRTGADVIITSVESVEVANTVQNMTGIPVVMVAAEGNISVGDSMFARDVRLVGDVLNMNERAEQLLSGIEELKGELTAKFDSLDSKCYIGGMFYMKAGGFYETTGNYVPLNLIGGKNAMPDRNHGNPYLTDVSSLSRMTDIDFMFVDSMTLANSKQQFIDSRDALGDINAVKDRNLYSMFVSKYYGTNWENELVNAYGIGSVIAGEKFADLESFANRVYKLFFGTDDGFYDLVVEKQNGFRHLGDWFDD